MRFLNTHELAELTGLSRSWFEHERVKGKTHGPPYIKVGRRVLYDLADVIRWLERHRTGPLTRPLWVDQVIDLRSVVPDPPTRRHK